MNTYIIAEIGINHNGSMEIVHDLMEAAADAGCDAVKFQKRDPEFAVPEDQKNVMKDTPWGRMRYIDYKQAIELWFNDYNQIDQWADELGLEWGVSVWDLESVEFMKQFEDAWIKIPSAKITDIPLLEAVCTAFHERTIMMSTGMSEMWEIEEAIRLLFPEVIFHCNSQYPCPVEDINLLAMDTLSAIAYECLDDGGEHEPDFAIGYSGHETGLATTVAAVAMGATYIERHITLDRSNWGTDQSASVEPVGFRKLVKDIRAVEQALGDGMIGVSAGEKPIRRKLRGS